MRSFTVVDDRMVTKEDVESNFFLSEDSIGSSISAAVTAGLQELNEDVRGESVVEVGDEMVQNV